MKVDEKLLQHLANLSRLHFTSEELAALQGEMTNIIGFVEKLNQLDTTSVKPLMHMSELQNVWREDQVGEQFSTAEALSPAANHDGHFFRVPKVINP